MKHIVDSLKAKDMYDSTVIVMASDNGGSPADGGNNWPLRGAKKTQFEGGVHVPGKAPNPKLLQLRVMGLVYPPCP